MRRAQSECGVIEKLVIDEDAGVAWVETNTHGMTLSLPFERSERRAPRIGEQLVYDPRRELVGVGPDQARRWFEVSREASALHEMHVHEGRARFRMAMIMLLSMAFGTIGVIQLVKFLAWMADHGFASPETNLPVMATTVVAGAIVFFWSRATRMWTYRPVLGVEPKQRRA